MIQTAKAIAANAEQIVAYANDIGALCLDKRYMCVHYITQWFPIVHYHSMYM